MGKNFVKNKFHKLRKSKSQQLNKIFSFDLKKKHSINDHTIKKKHNIKKTSN